MAKKDKLPGGTFAANLKACRLAYGWGVAELAERSGLDQSAVHRWEHGERQPTLPAILQLADAFSITASDLIEGIGPDGIPPRRKRKR